MPLLLSAAMVNPASRAGSNVSSYRSSVKVCPPHLCMGYACGSRVRIGALHSRALLALALHVQQLVVPASSRVLVLYLQLVLDLAKSCCTLCIALQATQGNQLVP